MTASISATIYPREREVKLKLIPQKIKHSIWFRMATIMGNVRSESGFVHDFQVSRHEILGSSFLFYEENFKSSSWYDSTVYPAVKITFKDECGFDVGGLTNEWISLLIESFFKPNPHGSADLFTLPLFHIVDEKSGVYAPNKAYPPEVYKFAGSILALAFNLKIGIKVEFIESIYRAIWRIEPVRIFTIKTDFPKISKYLYKVKFLNISKLGLDLYTGQTTEQYIKDYSHYLLYNKYKEEIDALADGFQVERNEKIRENISIPEFKQVLKGKVSFTADEFMRVATFEDGSDHLKSIFKEFLMEINDNQRVLLIQFMTGRNSLPFDGLQGIEPQLTVCFEHFDSDFLPGASTCSSMLFLPAFETKEELKDKLLFAFKSGCNFGRS